MARHGKKCRNLWHLPKRLIIDFYYPNVHLKIFNVGANCNSPKLYFQI
ncbi:hypothetical protein [Moraxella lacunata]